MMDGNDAAPTAASQVVNTCHGMQKLSWTHPAFKTRWRGTAAADHMHKARVLWERARRHCARLQEPDAWFSLQDNNLFFEPTPGTQPLRPGDVLQTAQVCNLPYITHDCLYVGKGFVASFARPKGCRLGEGAIHVDRLDEGVFLGKSWLPVPTPPSLSADHRLCRIWRALSSTGTYRYDPIFFNCQNVVAFWLEPHRTRTHSIGARRIASVVVLGTTVLACAVTVAVVHLVSRQSKPTR